MISDLALLTDFKSACLFCTPNWSVVATECVHYTWDGQQCSHSEMRILSGSISTDKKRAYSIDWQSWLRSFHLHWSDFPLDYCFKHSSQFVLLKCCLYSHSNWQQLLHCSNTHYFVRVDKKFIWGKYSDNVCAFFKKKKEKRSCI